MDGGNPYDEMLYPGYPFVQTHPDRLATLARLFGMNPSPVETCRVLELGCGDGANLIPMAVGLPGSEFVGIDLAARPIAQGAAIIQALELRNITLRQTDLLGITQDLGEFDYIIAHGLYSWVAAAVRDKILSICKTHLAPQGVAYVSYNTYPGGHLRQMTREMMLFHVRHLTDPQERLGQARGFIKSLSESQAESDGYTIFLKQESDRLLARADEALFHDDLAEINAPLYFHQFIEHARRHGLQYLTEARLAESQTNVFPPSVSEARGELGDDVVAKEQYFDFLKGRMFRQTLLCHSGIAVDRSLKPERIRNFYLASSARPVAAEPNLRSPGVIEQFRVLNGAMISIDHPLAKFALSHLGEIWPQAESFDQLLLTARRLIGPGDESHERKEVNGEELALCKLFLALYGADLVELRTQRPSFVTAASQRPVVSPLARLQAQDGAFVTTLRHTSAEVKDDLARRLLALLDGTRDRSMLLSELQASVASRGLGREEVKSEPTAQQPALKISLADLEQKLSELARLALLIA
jgi:cyclopropane fatty-acyl-phospholipid synthase-like methyltransferase